MVIDTKNVLKLETTRVSPAFARAFMRVHAAFCSAPEEIEAAKAAARERMVSAEDAYYAQAAMIEAGWNPLTEQASRFLKRTGFVVEARWPIVSPEHVDVQWPPKMRKAA